MARRNVARVIDGSCGVVYNWSMHELTAAQIDALVHAAETKRDHRKHAAYAEIEAADRDYESDLQAIQRIRGLALVTTPSVITPPAPETTRPLPTTTTATNGNGRHDWPGLRTAIRHTMNSLPETFSLDDVITWLSDRYPEEVAKLKRPYVSSVLWKMKRDGYIAVAEEGSGSRPATYRRDHQLEPAKEEPANGRLI